MHVKYHYRGLIERLYSTGRSKWVEGYSPDSAEGWPIFPWSPRRQCRREARLAGNTAVFYRDGVPEPRTKRPKPEPWRLQPW